MKKLIVLVLLLVIASPILVYNYLGTIVNKTLSKFAPQVLGVEVSVGDIELSFDGIEVRDIVVGNPDGFKEGYAFKIEEIDANFDIANMLSNNRVIDQIEIVEPTINYELDSKARSNLLVMQKNAEKYASSRPSEEAAQGESEEAVLSTDNASGSSSGEKSVVIKELLIEDAKVKITSPFLNETAVLPEMRLRDLGSEQSGGVSPAFVVQKVIQTIIINASKKFNIEKLLIKQIEGIMGKEILKDDNVMRGIRNLQKNIFNAIPKF